MLLQMQPSNAQNFFFHVIKEMLVNCFGYCKALFCIVFSGHVAERMNLRYFLSLGMSLSGILTLAFGFGYSWGIHSLAYYIIVQVSNERCYKHVHVCIESLLKLHACNVYVYPGPGSLVGGERVY